MCQNIIIIHFYSTKHNNRINKKNKINRFNILKNKHLLKYSK